MNRERLVKKLLPNSLALLVGNDIYPANADQDLPFIQNTNLFWMTGIRQPNTILILYPNHPNKESREILLITKPIPAKEKWTGKSLTPAEANAISGVEHIMWVEQIDDLLPALIHHCTNIYLNTNEHNRSANLILTQEKRWINKLQQRYPLHQYQRLAPILTELRSIKLPAEIEQIEHAVAKTRLAFERVCATVQPNIKEYEIRAEIMYSFIKNNTTEAYDTIIASGDNARILHYTTLQDTCHDGDLVLLDFGAQYNNYKADLSRTLPVNGTFTKRQKQLYDACLHIKKYATSLIKPGVMMQEYKAQVNEEASRVFLNNGLITDADIANESPTNRAFAKFFYHGVSHHLGLDVHDYDLPNMPFQEGMVLTVEPGIYVAEEKIGIRIEDDVVVTQNGTRNLMADFPIETSDIEAFIKQCKNK